MPVATQALPAACSPEEGARPETLLPREQSFPPRGLTTSPDARRPVRARETWTAPSLDSSPLGTSPSFPGTPAPMAGQMGVTVSVSQPPTDLRDPNA